MDMQSATGSKAVKPVDSLILAEPELDASTLLGSLAESHKQRLVILVLVILDVLLAFLVWEAATLLWSMGANRSISGMAVTGIASNVAVWIGLRALLGLYPGYGLDYVEELRRQTFAALAALVMTAVFASLLVSGGSLSSLLIVVMSFLGLLLLAPVMRYFVKRAMLNAGLWGKPVIVVGSQESGTNLLNVLRREWQLGFRPVMVFDKRLTPVRAMAEDNSFRGLPDDSIEMARKCRVDTIIFATPYTQQEDLAKLVSLAGVVFRYVIVMPNLGGITNSAVVARDFAGSCGVEIKHNLLDPWSRRIKRGLDLFATVVGVLLISPFLIVVIVLIKLDSPGPAFYGHRRLGADGKHFCCWKFRTMYTNAELLLDEFLQGNPDLQVEWEQNFKLRSDPRVTRVGRFLRKTSLDELPQLWNVLRGDMSLVGPRPIVDAEIPKYGAIYEMYRRIRPGISGFWQVSGRSDTDYAERVKLDAYYVHNWSIWLDLVILARTVRSVLLSRGAY